MSHPLLGRIGLLIAVGYVIGYFAWDVTLSTALDCSVYTIYCLLQSSLFTSTGALVGLVAGAFWAKHSGVLE